MSALKDQPLPVTYRALIWDETCVDAFASSHLLRSSHQTGSTGKKANILKHNKYSAVEDLYYCITFAAETLNAWGSDVKIFGCMFRKLFRKPLGNPPTASFCQQIVLLIIHRGKAASGLSTTLLKKIESYFFIQFFHCYFLFELYLVIQFKQN